MENNPINMVDPNGLAVTPYHYLIGYLGGWVNGCNQGANSFLAFESIMPDIWAFNDQNAHAMAEILPNGQPESPQDVYDKVKKIESQGWHGLHAIQDWDFKSHAGNPLPTNLLQWAWHEYWDFFDYEGIVKALADTVVYINEKGACRW